MFLNIGLVFAMSTERNGKLTPSLSPHLQICSGQWHLSFSSPLEKNFEGDLSSAAFTELTAAFVLAPSRTSADKRQTTVLDFHSLSVLSYPIWEGNQFLNKGEVEGGSSKGTKMDRETRGMISIPLPNWCWKKRKKPRDVAGEKWRQAMERGEGSTGGQWDTCHHKSPFPGLWVRYSRQREPPESLYTVFFSRSQDRKQSVSPPFVWYLAAVLKNTS